MRLSARAVTCALATLIGVVPAATLAQADSTRPGRWLVALGTEAWNTDLRTRDLGVRGTVGVVVGRELRVRPLRDLNLRIQGALTAALPTGIDVSGPTCPRCEVWYGTRTLTLEALARRTIRNRGQTALYLLGGPSISWSEGHVNIRGGPLTGEAAAQAPLQVYDAPTTVGVSAAVGFSRRLGGGHLVVEQYAQLYNVLSSPRYGRDDVRWPLHIGWRW